MSYWYDWNLDLYPLAHLPQWAQNRVLRWLHRRNIRPHTAPDLCAAAAEAYTDAVAKHDPGRGPLEPYVFAAMEKRLAQRVNDMLIGEETSRSARGKPNHRYVARNVQIADVDMAALPAHFDTEQQQAMSDEQRRDLRAATRSFPMRHRDPRQQQDRYLSNMHYRNAMRALQAEDRFAWQVASLVLGGLSRAEVARLGRIRKARVYDAYAYALRFLAARLGIENPDSPLAGLRSVWRREGLEPEWRGTNLVFPIPVLDGEDVILLPEDAEGFDGV